MDTNLLDTDEYYQLGGKVGKNFKSSRKNMEKVIFISINS